MTDGPISDRAGFDRRSEPTKSWEGVKDDVDHVGDVAAVLADARMLANGGVSLSMYSGPAYLTEATAAALASKRQFVFVRMYTVPRDAFVGDDAEVGVDDPNHPDWRVD